MLEFVLGSKVYPAKGGATGLEALKNLNAPTTVIGLKVNGEIRDLHMPLPSEGKVELVELDSPAGLEIVRHTAAHVLAQAVKEIWPQVQVTIGPVIENGFFYDFSKKDGFKEEDFKAIEEKMDKIIAKKLPIKREEWPVEKAIEHFKKQGEHYKCEIIQDIAKDTGAKTVSLYWHGDEFVDLCRGPHLPTTGRIPAFKLMSVAGAYWRGSEKNEMLARIYGTAFGSRDALKAYLAQIEEAKKRDHRRIGVDQDLFSFHSEVAPQAPFFHPSGAFIYIALQEFLRDLNKANGYQDVISPLILSHDLWKMSGHYDNYRENMYFTEIDERMFAVKPMNCPGHCMIYKNTRHSYRELPMRFAEFGRVHRHERSGVTAGLFRVRSFVQDDAHVFCTEDQILSEIDRILKMVKLFYSSLGFTYRVELSTRPEKRIGDDKIWDKAEGALSEALKKAGQEFKINPGDGAFYGPKIDFHLQDSIGRTHQCGTVQLDFSMPGRFGLEFSGSDNKAHIPVMIHRAIAGSMERFMGIYIEHVAGQFPFWMAPRQAAVLTISDDARAYGKEIFESLQNKGYRVELDDSSDKLAAKIKKYQPFKMPYLILIGDKEAQAKQLSLRLRDGSQQQGVSFNDLIKTFESQARPAVHSS